MVLPNIQNQFDWFRGHPVGTYATLSEKTNISYPLILTRSVEGSL